MIFKPAPKPSGQKSPYVSVLAAILCLSLLLPLVISASSCGTNFFYPNSDKYTVGGASLSHPISAIDIEWISGHVNVKYANDGENEVVFSESYDKKLDDDLLLHYWLDGTTLRIKFAASGKANFSSLNKTLTVTLPAEMPLIHLNVVATSADVNVSNVKAERISASSVSGDITASGIKTTESATFSSTSGKIQGSIASACYKLSLTSVSGSIDFETDARVRELSAENTSGKIKLANLNPAKNAAIESVSGGIELIFLDNAQFEVSFDSVSGDFYSEFAMIQSGNKHVCGSPTATFKVETASGDINIKKSPT